MPQQITQNTSAKDTASSSRASVAACNVAAAIKLAGRAMSVVAPRRAKMREIKAWIMPPMAPMVRICSAWDGFTSAVVIIKSEAMSQSQGGSSIVPSGGATSGQRSI